MASNGSALHGLTIHIRQRKNRQRWFCFLWLKFKIQSAPWHRTIFDCPWWMDRHSQFENRNQFVVHSKPNVLCALICARLCRFVCKPPFAIAHSQKYFQAFSVSFRLDYCYHVCWARWAWTARADRYTLWLHTAWASANAYKTLNISAEMGDCVRSMRT